MSDLILYPWKSINIEDAEKKLDVMLTAHRSRIATLLSAGPPYTWESLVEPLDEMGEELHRLWTPIGHLSNVKVPKDKDVREAERVINSRCMEQLSAYGTEISQSEPLYRAYRYIAESDAYASLSEERRAVIEDSLDGFRLSGIGLPPEQKERLKEISSRRAEIDEKFGENLVDAEGAWEKHVTDVQMLDGLPETIKKAAEEAAREKGLDGYLLTQGYATYAVLMENAKCRDLRREFLEGWLTRASDQGPHAGKWDNAPIVEEILALRLEKAKLLGFANHAELSLETKMAESTTEVMDFLNGILESAAPAAAREYDALCAYAKEKDGIDQLEMWDMWYYIARFKEEKFAYSDEELRKYFPLPHVLSGMFQIVERLYGITLRERQGVELWHPDAKFYEVLGPNGNLIGGLYSDLYERAGEKRGGAWMDTAIGRRALRDGSIQLPVGFMCCNFPAPPEGKPSLLSMREAETLFHEFGHNLHLLLTEVGEREVAGLGGVADDGIELPSQFMENFCWERVGIDVIAAHYVTGEKLPEELFQKVRAARTFGSGCLIGRQLIFSIFDFRLHMEYDGTVTGLPCSLYREVHERVSPFPLPSWARFAESFSHLFGGGYAAGYYGYLWANVLAADAFDAFLKEDGSIDWSVGEAFRREILSRGGSRPFMESFVAFRGRKPSIEPLLRQLGFVQ